MATRAARAIISSTPRFRSSSLMRTISSVYSVSLTVRRHPVDTLRSAPMVKSTDASISMPRWPRSAQRRSAVAIGVVEDVARHDRPDVHPHVALARDVDRGLHDPPIGRRRMGFAAGVGHRRLVGGSGGHGHHEVGHAHARLQRAAGADAQEPCRTQLDELLVHDRRARAAHAGRLHAERSTLERAGEAEHASLLVHQLGVVEDVLGHVLGSTGIARAEDGGGVVAGLGAQVDGHGAGA